ncbi:hypothetical protein [Wolbachia endosymbiont (group B) of Pandemis corylana]|nr:hypothetical protein [Wolbachia endosymbiont (group B) of Pandemis corylana]
MEANNQGKLKGKVKVPANIPAGTKFLLLPTNINGHKNKVLQH